MKIVQPIFILGSGRSGTTILYDLLAVHPDVCWFSSLMNNHPNHPSAGFLNRAVDIPVLGNNIKQAIIQKLPPYFIHPSEGENIYINCGFRDDQKLLKHADWQSGKLKKIIASHLWLTGKKRFLAKRTANTQRLAILKATFPDAYYIHIIRDGRAVSSSLLHSPWWENVPIWWLNGETPHQWRQEGKEPIELCALHWQRNVKEIKKNCNKLNTTYMEMRYEDLAADVLGSLRRILTFCNLPIPETYINNLPSHLINMNNKWKNTLTNHQKIILQNTIGPFAYKLGYK